MTKARIRYIMMSNIDDGFADKSGVINTVEHSEQHQVSMLFLGHLQHQSLHAFHYCLPFLNIIWQQY